MKFSITKLSLFGVACGFFSSSVALAQVPGQPQGGTQGFGSTAIGGATGAPGGAVGGGAVGGTTATSKYGFGAPGSGATGAALVEYSGINAVKGFSTTTSAGGGNALSNANAFGTNAFSNAATGVQGAQGGFNMNSIGAGLGAGLGANLGGGFGGRAGGLGGIGGLGGGLGGQSASNQAKKKIRVSVSPDIELASSSIATQSNGAPIALARLKRIPLPASLRGVNASLEGDMVVLTGIVATESDKRKVERLVKLEPGLNSVRNDVVVQSTSLEKIQARPNR
jgi:hypothetical protein